MSERIFFDSPMEMNTLKSVDRWRFWEMFIFKWVKKRRQKKGWDSKASLYLSQRASFVKFFGRKSQLIT